MRLVEKQWLFQEQITKLKQFAFSQGYKISGGDSYRSKRVFGEWGEKKGYGSAYSVHKLRLAEDLNLWVQRGEKMVYADKGTEPEWKILHNKWEELGGAPAIDGDMNHFSFEFRGYR